MKDIISFKLFSKFTHNNAGFAEPITDDIKKSFEKIDISKIEVKIIRYSKDQYDQNIFYDGICIPNNGDFLKVHRQVLNTVIYYNIISTLVSYDDKEANPLFKNMGDLFVTTLLSK